MKNRKIYIDFISTGCCYWKNSMVKLDAIIEIDGVVVDSFSYTMAPHPKASIDENHLSSFGLSEQKVKQFSPINLVISNIVSKINTHVIVGDEKTKFYLVGWENLQFLEALFKQGKSTEFNDLFWKPYIEMKTLFSNMFFGYFHLIDEFLLNQLSPSLGIQDVESKNNVELMQESFNIISNYTPKKSE